ncbi:MAG: glycoside hydrolase family 3 N-terminal domain-containing protein, partial [Bdellovibrionota bacterium]
MKGFFTVSSMSLMMFAPVIFTSSFASAAGMPAGSAVPMDKATEAKIRKYVGQMLIIGFRGYELKPEDTIVRDIQKNNLGGVILFDYDAIPKQYVRNIQSPEQLLRLTDQLRALTKEKLFISVDQEGGLVQRLKPRWGFTGFPSHQDVAIERKTNPNAVYDMSQNMAHVLRQYGFNLNFAPVTDVNINPLNPVIGKVKRSYSADPMEVAAMNEEFIRGHRAEKVLTSIKHFPGHGSSLSDSHLGFTDVTETWTNKELIPYQQLLKNDSVDTVMVSHVFNRKIDDKFPATLS